MRRTWQKAPSVGIAGEGISSNQLAAFGIASDIFGRRLNRVLFPFIVLQDVVVRLLLELESDSLQAVVHVLAKELHGRKLIGCRSDSGPQQMDMVRHQATDRAGELIAERGVSQQFAKFIQQTSIQPPGTSVTDRQNPMHPSLTTIVFRRQSFQTFWSFRSHPQTVAEVVTTFDARPESNETKKNITHETLDEFRYGARPESNESLDDFRYSVAEIAGQPIRKVCLFQTIVATVVET